MAKIRKFAAFIVCVLVWISFIQKVKAQNPSSYYIEDPRTFYAGVIAGTNFTQVDGDSYAGYHKVGLNAGGIVYANVGENLAASLEILFSQKGARGHQPQASANNANLITKFLIDLNYAEVPVMINYFDRRRSHFGGGFSYSYIINANQVIETNPFDPVTSNLEQYKFRKSDINIVLGGNLHLVKGLFLNLRFQYSLIPIRKEIPPGYGRSEQYSNIWAIRLMYLF